MGGIEAWICVWVSKKNYLDLAEFGLMPVICMFFFLF